MRYALSNHSSSFHASPKYSQYLVHIRHPHVIRQGENKKKRQRERNNGKKVQYLLEFGLFFCGKSIWRGDKTVGTPTGAKKHKEKGKKVAVKLTKSDSRSVSKKPVKMIFPILSLPTLHTHTAFLLLVAHLLFQ